MSKASHTITVDPDSDLGRALDEAAGEPLILISGERRFRVTSDPDNPWVTSDPDNPWATYDPELVRASLRSFAGMLMPEDGERMKETIKRGRAAGTRPFDRP